MQPNGMLRLLGHDAMLGLEQQNSVDDIRVACFPIPLLNGLLTMVMRWFVYIGPRESIVSLCC